MSIPIKCNLGYSLNPLGFVRVLILTVLLLISSGEKVHGMEAVFSYANGSGYHNCNNENHGLLLCQRNNTRVANVQKRLDSYNTYLVGKKVKFLKSLRQELADPALYTPEQVGVVSPRNVDKVEVKLWQLEESDSEYREKYEKKLIEWGRIKPSQIEERESVISSNRRVCADCGGKGVREVYHNGRWWEIRCRSCGGSGNAGFAGDYIENGQRMRSQADQMLRRSMLGY